MVNTRNLGRPGRRRQQIVNRLAGAPTQLILLWARRSRPTAASSAASATSTAVAISVAGGQRDRLPRRWRQQRSAGNISRQPRAPDALQEFKVESGVRQARYGVTRRHGQRRDQVGTNASTAPRSSCDHNFNAVDPISKRGDGLMRAVGGNGAGLVLNSEFFGASGDARS
jgi:hypothetical protein